MSAPERDDAQMALAAALVRLRQYGEQTATYTDAAEKALHQIALTLAAEVSSLSDEVTGARLSLWEDGQENLRLRLALTSAQRGRRELRTRLEAFEALELGTPEGRVSAKCEDASHPVWLRDLDDVRGCPWCRVAELEALTPAPIQTCQSCGAGYDYGQPCSVCAFKKRMADELAKDGAEEALLTRIMHDDEDEPAASRDLRPGADAARRMIRDRQSGETEGAS